MILNPKVLEYMLPVNIIERRKTLNSWVFFKIALVLATTLLSVVAAVVVVVVCFVYTAAHLLL